MRSSSGVGRVVVGFSLLRAGNRKPLFHIPFLYEHITHAVKRRIIIRLAFDDLFVHFIAFSGFSLGVVPAEFIIEFRFVFIICVKKRLCEECGASSSIHCALQF